MYELPELDFDYDALEPHMDEETLKIHHGKHHAAYVKKFNDSVEGTEYEKVELRDLIVDLDKIKGDIQTPIRNAGGGAYNHSFFWEILTPEKDSGEPLENTAKAINESFGSYDEFKKQFSEAALTVFGSGWAWLVVGEKGLEIVKTPNQDNPMSVGLKPILVIDIWEHAYYLKYRNLRPDYIEAFFNIINWKAVEKKFLE
ncbi:MAG: superoxide dismutase [Nanoarchaeota archaeon]|nr:superoxide dismutase [Nanoarchaeota archaeon]